MEEGPTYWREQAARCRRLANQMSDERALAALLRMADEFEAEASKVLKDLMQQTPNALQPKEE